MTWFMEAVGWGGSALLIASILQTRMWRLRVCSLIACALLTWYNAVVGVWPMVAMNAAIGLINVYYLVKMARDRTVKPTDDSAPAVTGGNA